MRENLTFNFKCAACDEKLDFSDNQAAPTSHSAFDPSAFDKVYVVRVEPCQGCIKSRTAYANNLINAARVIMEEEDG